VDSDGYSDYFIRNFVFGQKTFLRALCGFFVPLVVFLPQSPQSRRKAHQGVSVFITRLIPYKQILAIRGQAPCGQLWLFRLLYSQFRFRSENFSPCPLWILCALCGLIFSTTELTKQAQISQRGICIYQSFDSIFQQSNVKIYQQPQMWILYVFCGFIFFNTNKNLKPPLCILCPLHTSFPLCTLFPLCLKILAQKTSLSLLIF